MSKYNQLWQYIQDNYDEDFSLTFAEIGCIAGVPLDHSFLHYKKELSEYGFEVQKISMKYQQVNFHKI